MAGVVNLVMSYAGHIHMPDCHTLRPRRSQFPIYRRFAGIELNPEYIKLIEKRCAQLALDLAV